MNRISIEQYPQSFEEALRQVVSGEPVIITQHGQDLAALIPIQNLPFWKRLLEEAEDRFDREEAQRRLLEVKAEEWVPLEEVRRKAGWL